MPAARANTSANSPIAAEGLRRFEIFAIWPSHCRPFRAAAAGRLKAKTGSLETVVSLSGLVDEKDAAPLAFSMIVNDVARDALGRALEERVGVALARWPAVAPTADLGPAGG